MRLCNDIFVFSSRYSRSLYHNENQPNYHLTEFSFIIEKRSFIEMKGERITKFIYWTLKERKKNMKNWRMLLQIRNPRNCVLTLWSPVPIIKIYRAIALNLKIHFLPGQHSVILIISLLFVAISFLSGIKCNKK